MNQMQDLDSASLLKGRDGFWKRALLLVDLGEPVVCRPKVRFEIEALSKLLTGFVVSMGVI
jgi:hypothetical protein